MDKAVELFGFLVLSFVGIVAPTVTILLSLFREGMTKLSAQYEIEKSQSEKNIKEQLKKQSLAEDTNVKDIEESLRKLKSIKKTAVRKLAYLNPSRQVSQLFLPLLISFIAILVAYLYGVTTEKGLISIIVSITAFAFALIAQWNLLKILIEVTKIIDDDKRNRDAKTIELLSELVEKDTEYYLKQVFVTVENLSIKDDNGVITIEANKKQELKVGINNDELRMAKNVEAGFVFPFDFIVEKTDNYTIYAAQPEQIVRYNTSQIHGNTYVLLKPLIITPLKSGKYRIRTFLKGENIEAIYRRLTFNVTEIQPGEIKK